MDTNSLESEYLFAEKKLATVLSSIIFSLALFSNIKKLSIPFFAFWEAIVPKKWTSSWYFKKICVVRKHDWI